VIRDAPVLPPEELPGSPLLDLKPDGLPVAPLVLVDLSRAAGAAAIRAAEQTSRVLVGVAPDGVHPGAAALAEALTVTVVSGSCSSVHEVSVADLAVAASTMAARVVAAPRAASALVDLLRLTSRLGVRDGLMAESFAYSMLLTGPEFAGWRAARPRRPAQDEPGPLVRAARDGDVLDVVLARPRRHNAYSRAVRDELVAVLDVALHDPDVRVRLSGDGPSFCSGGDLDEFGTAQDLALAHLVRTARSAGMLLHRLRDRAEAELHGMCMGAGLELPAFTGRVLARPDARLALPELGMGLVPGAGGTVSVTRRAGRWRTAWLVLSGEALDPQTALEWGIVDGLLPAAAGPG
jgi:enoyl-CoA hydratase/carnithine racemase